MPRYNHQGISIKKSTYKRLLPLKKDKMTWDNILNGLVNSNDKVLYLIKKPKEQKVCQSLMVVKTLIHRYYVRCMLCEDKKATVIHHIDKIKNNNNYNNYMPLCRGCHTKAHYHVQYKQKIESIINIDLH